MIAQRSSPHNPCPVCAGTHGCSVADTGLVMCRRRDGDVTGFRHIGPAPKNPEWNLYVPLDALPARDVPAPKARPKPKAKRAEEKAAHDWEAEAATYARDFVDDPARGGSRPRLKLALALGLPVEVLDLLPLLGVKRSDNKGPCWTIPERDGTGKVIGILRRLLKPKPGESGKPTVSGSNRGLTIVDGWRERPGPVFLVEGASDTLAMTAAGLSAVGRPSNMTGGDHLVTLLADWSADRDIVIVGENDLKPDGRWPGKEGADHVANHVARGLRRPVSIVYPPNGAKDARAWFLARVASGSDWAAAGREFASSLTYDRVTPTLDPFDIDATYVIATPSRAPFTDSTGSGTQGDVVESVAADTPAGSDEARLRSSKGGTDSLDTSSLLLEERQRAEVTRQDPSEDSRPRCRNGRPLLVEGVGRQERNTKVIRPSCNRWSCPECNNRMRENRKAELVPAVMRCESPVAVWEGGPKEFSALREHLKRLTGSMPRVCTVKLDEDRMFAVFLDAPDSPRITRTEPAAAARLLTTALDLFLVVQGSKAHPFRPINVSKNFLPPDKPPRAPQQWRRVGPTKLSLDEIVKLLTDRGVFANATDFESVYPIAGGRPVSLITWSYPAGMPLEEQADINRAIVTGVIDRERPFQLSDLDDVAERLLAAAVRREAAPSRAYVVEVASPPPSLSRVEERGAGVPLPADVIRWRYADEGAWRTPKA